MAAGDVHDRAVAEEGEGLQRRRDRAGMLSVVIASSNIAE